MSDTTVVPTEGSGGALMKKPFRVPFLSGRLLVKGTTAETTPVSDSAKTDQEKTELSASSDVETQITTSTEVETNPTLSGTDQPPKEPLGTGDNQTLLDSHVSKMSNPEEEVGVSEEGIATGFDSNIVTEVKEAYAPLGTEISKNINSRDDSLPKTLPGEAGITLGLSMVEALSILRKRQDEFFTLKESEYSGATLKLIKQRNSVSLLFIQSEAKISFCLTFLTAAVSRSSTTLIEASFLVREGSQNPEAFVDKLISFKKDAWDEVRNGGLPDETSAILALAPLMTLMSIKDIFKNKDSGHAAVEKDAREKKAKEESAVIESTVQVGEDIWTVVRDELKKIKPQTTADQILDKESSFNGLIREAVEEIQKNSRAYGIEGGVRILIPGNPINRKAIYDLLVDFDKRITDVISPTRPHYTTEKTGDALVANQLNALESITGETGIAAPSAPSEEILQEDTSSAVNDSNSDTVSKMFLDDALVRIIKLICKVDDTKNLEDCFKKHASLTMKDFMVAMQTESPLIQSEVTAFMNWAKKSYLKEKIPVLDGMTLVLVLTMIERGVGGALSSTNGTVI